MSTTLVFVEHQDGQLKRSSVELLQAATKNHQKTLALVLGSQAGGVAASCAQNGAQEVHVFKDAKLDNYNPELYLAALQAAQAQPGAEVVRQEVNKDNYESAAKVANARMKLLSRPGLTSRRLTRQTTRFGSL